MQVRNARSWAMPMWFETAVWFHKQALGSEAREKWPWCRAIVFVVLLRCLRSHRFGLAGIFDPSIKVRFITLRGLDAEKCFILCHDGPGRSCRHENVQHSAERLPFRKGTSSGKQGSLLSS
ncbi:hypothetical protein CC80DRAFT_294338 [Byssothecium circinans]|uniref:Uncharacterized protein n=1 Tax=Byssothecium circinans TaxID=147558 RepID=A0A6A5UC36_9PLEO|nr:hypothetical protein CC80DRAFT_294338 [Byssothecium circinans]